MKNRHLFLFGGSPPFQAQSGKRFAHLALNEKGSVAILLIEREGWKEYMPKYTSVLEEYGVRQFEYFSLSLRWSVSSLNKLKTCTGIIICGGDTERYQHFIVDTPIGEQIKTMYKQGVPCRLFSGCFNSS